MDSLTTLRMSRLLCILKRVFLWAITRDQMRRFLSRGSQMGMDTVLQLTSDFLTALTVCVHSIATWCCLYRVKYASCTTSKAGILCLAAWYILPKAFADYLFLIARLPNPLCIKITCFSSPAYPIRCALRLLVSHRPPSRSAVNSTLPHY